MTGAVEFQPAYVLHSRPYRDSSLIVNLFSRDAGRMAVVVRGARSGKRALRQQLQPFTPLLVSYRGRSELKTLTAVEAQAAARLLHGEALYSAFYVNELLMRLLPECDPHPELYLAYRDFLDRVSMPAAALEPPLRQFEFALLAQLGYALAFDADAGSGAPLAAETDYRFVPEQGFIAVATPADRRRSDCFSGAALIAIGAGEFQCDAVRRAAKRLARLALRPLLGSRPLKSREFFTTGPH